MACFVVTGGAGFIGSNLVHALVNEGHAVRVLDDLSTGRRENLAGLEDRIELFEGSICDGALVSRLMAGAEFCLHHAAIPSVERSIKDPSSTNRINVEGTLTVFLAARDAGVKRLVYASSSSVYGDSQVLPSHEDLPLAPISPYGVSKAAGEFYAEVFSRLYGMDLVGLRYFNVFGPRQNPRSQYAAVIPLFISKMSRGEPPLVHGDGGQSRDFSYIDNVVSANLKACRVSGRIAGVYNIACGATTSILELVKFLNEILATHIKPNFGPARPGDIRCSWAAIERARTVLGYEPEVNIREGLRRTVEWFRKTQDFP